jgi:hypothetical protein
MKKRCTHQLCILLNAVAIPCLCGWASALVESRVGRLGQPSEFPNLYCSNPTTRVILLLGWRGRTMPLEYINRPRGHLHACIPVRFSLSYSHRLTHQRLQATESAIPTQKPLLPHHEHRTFEGNALTINLEVHIIKQFSSLW